jgi:hypothetical protein
MTREETIERYLCRIAFEAGYRTMKLTGYRGIPDRIILAPGGRVAFAEVKRPRGGVRSVHQKTWIKFLQSFGFIAEFVSTYGEADALILRLESERHEEEL